MKPLNFFDYGTRKVVKLSNYIVRLVRTKRGIRKQAVANHEGRELYTFVK